MSASRLIEVTYGGYAGTYWQPPESAELTIYCGDCGQETDARASDLYPGDVLVTCAAGHEVTVYLEGGGEDE